MSFHASAAIMRHELRVMWSDPSTVIFIVFVPLLMVALMQNLFAGALEDQGFAGANGSEFAIPGMAVSFAAFGAGFAGFAFFRDHGWGTWDRLRATAAGSVDLMVGKVLPTVGVTIAQVGLLFLLGVPLFDLEITGSILALAVLILLTSLALCAFGMAVTAVSRTMQQLNALASVGGFAMALIGGAWVPVASMPGWAQAIAPAMPTYWSMKGFESVLLKGGGLTDIMLPVVLLIGFGALFTAFTAARFRFEDSKVYYG
jgi:ABC-2 type transport system permease protein